jgi:hypothetical protein
VSGAGVYALLLHLGHVERGVDDALIIVSMVMAFLAVAVTCAFLLRNGWGAEIRGLETPRRRRRNRAGD